MLLQDYDKSRPYRALVRSIKRITPDESPDDVKEIILEVENPEFDYKIGQLIGVLVPGPHALGHQEHFRLYTLTTTPERSSDHKHTITLLVKRCNYIDEYSGEEYIGIASNYLCNLHKDDHVAITGPYGLPFQIPDEKTSNILMIGLGTGIAPFRAFVKHIYEDIGEWKGKVHLFYGARTGMEMLYMNDHRNDFANYYDESTFAAFQAISSRPEWNEDADLVQTFSVHEQEVWDLLCSYNTYVYVAGLTKINDMLDEAFGKMAGTTEKWKLRKKELIAGKRWTELLY